MKNSTNVEAGTTAQTDANTVLVDSKKMLIAVATKDLYHMDGRLCFKKDKEYDVVRELMCGYDIKNEMGYAHTITEGKWLAFFYFR